MKQLSIAVVLVCALAPTSVFAHDSPTGEYRPVQFYCYDMPLVLRKQARNQQQFQFSNIGFYTLYYIIFPDVFGGSMDGNIDPDLKEGLIPEGKSLVFTNTELQLRNVQRRDEEGAEVCFTPVTEEEDTETVEYEWRFEPNGRVSVREIRRAASGWVSFTIPKGATWWTVRRRFGEEVSFDSATLSSQKRRSRY